MTRHEAEVPERPATGGDAARPPGAGPGSARAPGAQDLDTLYDEILRLHGAALRRLTAAYEADPSRRDDLFQDICLALWQALPRFRGAASARTYAFRIAHNRGITHRARRRAPAAPLREIAELADPRPGPETELGREERRRRLHAAVLDLPLPYRQVLTLALEGLSQREISEVLGISDNNVAVRLFRARTALRRRLQPVGETS